VVTANKALIAEHGNELIAAAEEAGVSLLLRGSGSGCDSDSQGPA
jgi:homoserine dehydrogenase